MSEVDSLPIIFIAGAAGATTEHSVPHAAAMQCGTLRNMIADVDDLVKIPLPAISGATLEKIIVFCDKYPDDDDDDDDDDEPEPRDLTTTRLSEWDTAFVNISLDALFALIAAANFLDHPKLLGVGCKALAETIANKSPADIKAVFGIESYDAFTETEVAHAVTMFPWMAHIE
jgi:S-phase kinase-associated protein 1